MKPNRAAPRDESDDALDRAIRAATAESPPVEIKQRVIESAALFTPSSHSRWWRRRRHSWFVAASAALAVSGACVIAFLLMPSSSVALEDVRTAVKSQSWIRVARTGDNHPGTTWLSPERQVWAFRTNNWFIFTDGRERAKYEYRTGRERIEKMALSEEDTQLVSAVDYVSQGLWLFGTERVVSQERREFKEAGKKWIEFDMVLWRGDMNLGTLRVDPETRLPVYLLLRSQTDAKKSMKYDFTYLDAGPADIYALGVPAETKIDDRMPPKDAQRVLEAIAASRARIGDFRLVVAEIRDGQRGGPDGLIVWRKGDRWRIDKCKVENESARTAKPPDGQGWGDPFIEKLKLSWLGPLYLCDGRTVYVNPKIVGRRFEEPRAGTKDAIPITWQRAEHIAPRDLLSGEGLGSMNFAFRVKIASMVYPDLSPIQGWGFEYDPRPPAMPGCVLIKRSAQTTLLDAKNEPIVGHEWYYLDPTKGYAVVRVELFNLSGAPADPTTAPGRTIIRLEDFQQSPQGQQLPQRFWYPSTRLESQVELDTPRRPAAKQKSGHEVPYLHAITTHYHFDFNVALPDELFVMDEVSKSGKQ